MSSKAVAERPESKVPDLVRTPALTITAEDIVLPRLSIGQYSSKAVQRDLVKPGQIYSHTGQEDSDPEVLYTPGDAGGVVFHVINLLKRKSISEGGELTQFDFDDPNAPADAWVTYNYTVVIPAQDADVPYKVLFTKSGRPAALKINTVLMKNSISGPAWINAFSFTTAPRENAKGKFFVPQISVVDAAKKDIEIAEKLAVSMSSSAVEHSATGEQPAI